MKLPAELQKAGINEQDFEEKRKAYEKEGKSSGNEEICLGLYEDLIEECNGYQKLEKLFKAIARIQEHFGIFKKAFKRCFWDLNKREQPKSESHLMNAVIRATSLTER